MPCSLPIPDPFGLWIATENADYTCFRSETSEARQDHVPHEVGHILADHQSGASDQDVRRSMPSDIFRKAVVSAPQRTSYDE
ncbi:hypothetical protein [Streptomyces sp. WMMC905]|uniref:hypothetical protein n=1 Tax=Streptomyces sp. WMMC905 TaxID=3404123 RepID=UPI003B940F8B